MMDEEKRKKVVEMFKSNSEPNQPNDYRHVITGNYNVQINEVAGNVTIVDSLNFDRLPTIPAKCPACGHLHNNIANQCSRCSDNFESRRHDEQHKRRIKTAVIILGAALCCSLAALHDLLDTRTPSNVFTVYIDSCPEQVTTVDQNRLCSVPKTALN